MEIIVFELAKALKVPRSLPADNLQAADFQVLDGHIARNQCRAKSLGVSRNHDVKDTCAPSKPLGSNSNTGMGLSGLFIPQMNRYAAEEHAHGRHDGRLVLSKARTIEQFRYGDA